MANENMIKFLRGNVANLPQTATAGALYFTKDEGIYMGMEDGSYHRYGEFIVVADVDSLPASGAHETCMYYCAKENILAKYDSTKGTWAQINKQPTAEELKTLLGLGSLAYLSEVGEGNLSSALLEKVNASAEGNHSHSNKGVLDGITADKVSAWDAAEQNAKDYADGLDDAMNTRVEALEAIDHEHTFVEAELNKIVDGDVAKWNTASEKAHTHTFVETELNKIVEGDVVKWNAAEKNAKDYADGLDGAMNTRVEALETAIGENGSVATQIKTAIETLDFTDVAVDGEYVSAVNEVDGKISVTRKALPDYSNTYDAKGAADTAFDNAKAYADGLAANYDEKGAAAGVKTELEAEIAKKVDKVEGKSLVLDTEIAKLAGVSAGANKVEASANNGSIKIDGVETVVYTHPASHTVSEISDFDEKVKAYDYATKTEAQAMADGKDEAIAAAKKAGDDAQDAIDTYIESNNTALAGVKATADAAAVKTEVETALAGKVDKVEGYSLVSDAEIARLKDVDNYDDTALAGRVTTAEGKITALETASATHATKDEAKGYADAKDEAIEAAQKTADDLAAYVGTFTASEGVDTVVKYIDAKTANIASDERVNGIDNRVKAIEDDYLVEADIANFETKENVKKVADDLAGYKTSNDEALAGVKAIAEAARTEDEVNSQIDAKITALDLANTYEPKGAEKNAKDYVDQKFTDANLDQYTTEAEVKSIVDGVIASAAYSETYNSLTKLVDYIDTHGGEASEMAQAIETLEGDVKGLKEAPSAGIKATDIEAWNGEIGAKALAETKTTTAEVKDQIEAYGYATTGYADGKASDAQSAAEAKAAELDAALKTELEGAIADGDAATLEAAKTDASNKDAVVLAEAQKYADQAEADAISAAETKAGELDATLKAELQGEINAKANSADVYTKAEVDALFTWGSF